MDAMTPQSISGKNFLFIPTSYALICASHFSIARLRPLIRIGPGSVYARVGATHAILP